MTDRPGEGGSYIMKDGERVLVARTADAGAKPLTEAPSKAPATRPQPARPVKPGKQESTDDR